MKQLDFAPVLPQGQWKMLASCQVHIQNCQIYTHIHTYTDATCQHEYSCTFPVRHVSPQCTCVERRRRWGGDVKDPGWQGLGDDLFYVQLDFRGDEKGQLELQLSQMIWYGEENKVGNTESLMSQCSLRKLLRGHRNFVVFWIRFPSWWTGWRHHHQNQAPFVEWIIPLLKHANTRMLYFPHVHKRSQTPIPGPHSFQSDLTWTSEITPYRCHLNNVRFAEKHHQNWAWRLKVWTFKYLLHPSLLTQLVWKVSESQKYWMKQSHLMLSR